MRHLLAYGHRPGGSRLSASPRIVLSRFLSFFQHVHNNRQRRRSERTKAQDRGDQTTQGSSLFVTEAMNQPGGQVTLPDSCSAWVRFQLMQGKFLQFFASAIIDMWVPIVIYAHNVQHFLKLRPSFSLFFAHSTLCGHFENSISF